MVHKADDRTDSLSQTLSLSKKGATANAASRDIASGGNIASAFLGMPSGLAMSMDVRKWSWPGALTFGKGVEQKKPAPQEEETKSDLSAVGSQGTAAETEGAERRTALPERGIKATFSLARSPSTMTEVDKGALQDAISSNGVRSLLEKGDNGLSSAHAHAAHEGHSEMDHSGDTPRPSRLPSPLPADDKPHKPDPNRQLDFACTFVFLAESGNPLETYRKQVIHLRVSIILYFFIVLTFLASLKAWPWLSYRMLIMEMTMIRMSYLKLRPNCCRTLTELSRQKRNGRRWTSSRRAALTYAQSV
jgi:hypothetical protein